MSSAQLDSFLVQKEETSLRLDQLLSHRFQNYSRAYFQYLIKEGFVLINGTRVKKREHPTEGDEIAVFFALTPEISLEPQKIALDILYEDEHILVVNKPAGMVVHPAPGHPSQTFVNALLAHCQDLPVPQDTLRPGIVHRLDKDTSGILLAAKTTIAHQRLISSFCKQEIHKTYLAICVHKPANQILSTGIARHPVKRKEMTVTPTGKIATSEIAVLAYNNKISLVLIRPKTGRTHQIRVHLQHLRSPVLGDAVYGIPSMNHHYNISRQLLHAYKVECAHPITKEPLHFTAPIPADIKSFITKIKDNQQTLNFTL